MQRFADRLASGTGTRRFLLSALLPHGPRQGPCHRPTQFSTPGPVLQRPGADGYKMSVSFPDQVPCPFCAECSKRLPPSRGPYPPARPIFPEELGAASRSSNAPSRAPGLTASLAHQPCSPHLLCLGSHVLPLPSVLPTQAPSRPVPSVYPVRA